jgi:hypothetical protein
VRSASATDRKPGEIACTGLGLRAKTPVSFQSPRSLSQHSGPMRTVDFDTAGIRDPRLSAGGLIRSAGRALLTYTLLLIGP